MTHVLPPTWTIYKRNCMKKSFLSLKVIEESARFIIQWWCKIQHNMMYDIALAVSWKKFLKIMQVSRQFLVVILHHEPMINCPTNHAEQWKCFDMGNDLIYRFVWIIDDNCWAKLCLLSRCRKLFWKFNANLFIEHDMMEEKRTNYQL